MLVWKIVAIVLIIAMMVGPMMMMRPSRRETRLAKLRALANQQGVKVRLCQWQDELLANYKVIWPAEVKLNLSWALDRQPYSHGLHLAECWAWRKDRQAPPQLNAMIEQALLQLPGQVVAIDCDEQGLAFIWREQGEEAEFNQLLTWARQLMDTLKRSGLS